MTTAKILNWWLVLLLLAAAFILGVVTRRALAADPFIYRLEMLFGVTPGSIIPVDMRAPDVRLQYRGTRPTTHGCYEVNICRLR